MCFRNTVRYLRENNSNVYVCSLDLAFDKINHVTLLKQMIGKGYQARVVRVFAYWFDKMCGIDKHNKEFSSVFLIGSGVLKEVYLGVNCLI